MKGIVILGGQFFDLQTALTWRTHPGPSVLALREEWMGEEDEQYRIPGGFDQMINFLERKCLSSGVIIHTSSPVVEIKWKKNDAKNYFRQGVIQRSEGDCYHFPWPPSIRPTNYFSTRH